MGLDDTFEFDGAAYRRRVKNMTHAELRQREIVKYRQTMCASWSMGSGVGLAFFTFGASLIGTALAARRFKIANKKLEIVNAELKSRNISLYVKRKRDVFIPLSVCVLTLGIGYGASMFMFDTTSTSTAGIFSDSGTTMLDEAVHNPADFASDVFDGATAQADQVTDIPIDPTHEGVASLDAAIIDANASGVDTSAFALGMGMMQGLEIALIQDAVSPLSYQYLCAETKKKSQVCSLATPADCAHKSAPYCIQCSRKVNRDSEVYYHCCRCHYSGYLFNACEPCLMTLEVGCREREQHVLHRITSATEPENVASEEKKPVQVTTKPVVVV